MCCRSEHMSLLFNMLSRLVITFLQRSKRLLISWLQSQFAVILEPQKIKSVTVPIDSPSTCHEVMEPDAIILVFWWLSFKPAFSLSSFTFIKRLFSSSSLSAIRVVSSAYLRLLVFLPALLIPACASSCPAIYLMYSEYKVNKERKGKERKVKSLSHVQLFATPRTVTYQAPLSMGFSRQEYWSGMLFPSPGDLPDSGIEPRSPALQADALPSRPPGRR